MKKLCVILGTAALLAACGEEPVRTAADIGSGWEDLDGSIVNYEYPDFSGFYLHFRNGALQWKGFAGLFKGVVAEVDLVASKVNDRVYFMSWPTPNGGGDNVIMNFDTMKVHAHLGPGDGFQLFSGTIYCRDTPDCNAPEGEPMGMINTMRLLAGNARELGYSSPMDANEAIMEKRDGRFQEPDMQGMAELTGKPFAYQTPEGLVRVSIAGEETSVSVAGAEPVISPTYATAISNSIYYVSWHGEHGGNHVVLDSGTMKVYDQIMPDGTRKEGVFDAICFASEGC